jgi:hypothetical protein
VLISLYETRIRRTVEKDVAALQAMQAQRKASYSRAQDEAIRRLQLALSQGEAYDPGEDFLPASAHGGVRFFSPRTGPRHRPQKPHQPLLRRQQAHPMFPKAE